MTAYANPISRINEAPLDRQRVKFEVLLAMFTREQREAERKAREEREARERAEADAKRAKEQAEAREKLDVWLAMHRGRPAPRGMR